MTENTLADRPLDTVPAPRLIRLPEVLRRTGLSRSTVYAKIKSDDFPTAVQCGARARAWLEQEVSGWIEARAGERATLKAGGHD